MNTSQKKTPPSSLHKTRRPWWQWGIVAIVLLAALLVSGRWLVWRLGHVVTNAAFIKADITQVAPELPARILAIDVVEGQRVEAGQILMRLDSRVFDDQEKMAAAAVGHLEAKVERYKAKHERARREVPALIEAARQALLAAEEQERRARSQEEFLAKQKARFAALLDEQAVGKARYEEVEAGWRAAHAAAAAAAAKVGAARAKLREAQAARARIAEAAAAWKEALAGVSEARQGLALARVQQAKAEIRAPVAGVIARLFPKPGDLATPGRPVVAIYDPETIYVEARFEETKLRHLRPGQRVVLTIDAFPSETLYGTIRLIHRAAAGEFALIPRDVTAGEFTKLTQRVPVEIELEDAAKALPLIPGYSVEVAAHKKGKSS